MLANRSYRQRDYYSFDDSLFTARRDSVLNVIRQQTDTVVYKDIFVLNRSQRGVLRNKFLNKLNLIREGEIFSEQLVEDTYARFSSIPLFSTVNINLQKQDSTSNKNIISNIKDLCKSQNFQIRENILNDENDINVGENKEIENSEKIRQKKKNMAKN